MAHLADQKIISKGTFLNSLRLTNNGFKQFKGIVITRNEGCSENEAALASSAPIEFLFYIPRRLAATEARLLIKNETSGKEFTIDTEWMDTADEFDVFGVKLDLDTSLYFFSIALSNYLGSFFGYKSEGSEMLFSPHFIDSKFQLSVVNFEHPCPDGFAGGIVYHIFVDRFAKSKRTVCKKGALLADYTSGIPEYPAYPGAPLKNNTFWGGDLYGVIDKLDYISSLGANIIYLSPIFDSPSNHKYDTADYLKVDEMFGSREALTLLIDEAHKRGIKIILDGVFNHTGADSVYFNRYGTYDSLGAYQSQESPYYNWYEFQSYPNKYTCWWDIEILPRINTRLHSCSDFFAGDGGVIQAYAKMGIDGFRLDVADELSDDFIEQIKNSLSKESKGSILYGEVWEDASNKIAYSERKKYYLGKELDGVMNYPVRVGIIDYVLHKKTDALKYALTDVLRNAPKRIRDLQMNLLGSHDTERILTVLGGEVSDGLSNDILVSKRMSRDVYERAKERLKLAYTILATIPGIPSIFYGDEAGLEGYGDPFNRLPYPWGREDTEILDFYKRIGVIRREHPVYTNGDFDLLVITPELLIFKRTIGNSTLLTVINNANDKLILDFSASVTALIKRKTSDTHTLAPYSSEIFDVCGKTTYLNLKNIKE